jgi:hypothetical protein
MDSFKHVVGFLKEYDGITNEALRLKLLADAYRSERRHVSEYLEVRQSWHKAVKELSENGKVAVIWSGMDCDCVRYSNNVRMVDANWKAIEEHINSTYEWADGPAYYGFEKPSVARELEYESRDLALEAFEDGHPYSIHY